MRVIVRTGIWAAMLTAGAAVVMWGLGAEKATEAALALAERDAPVEMIVGGAVALPSKTAQAWQDWNEDDGQAADDRAESADTAAEPDQVHRTRR